MMTASTPVRLSADSTSLGVGSIIGVATIICGTLDIMSAFAFGAVDGVTPGQVLRFVASGPLGDSMRSGGVSSAIAGLGIHFALMGLMVAVFVLASAGSLLAAKCWPVVGVIYGVLIYGVMYWVVIPMRFGFYPRADAWHVGNALFSHIFCVGLPMSWLVLRMRAVNHGGDSQRTEGAL